MAPNRKKQTQRRRAPITAYDVASLAGVSQSAVSRTFTFGASVSERTREKVLKAAKKLNHRPNLIARSLSTRRSDMVGMIVPALACGCEKGAGDHRAR
jgi:DNA-binding LacI/PurR family transcriptional regulator